MNWVLVRLLAALLALAACDPRETGPRPIGEAYVAPETLELRKEIAVDSGAVATVKRGDKVEIMQKRRRFARVRTPAKLEGWTELGKLLTPEIFQQIEKQARESASLPHHGVYRARDTLNVHLEPYRASPSFYQIQEEGRVELLARRVVERIRSAQPPQPSDKPTPYDDWCLVRAAEPGGRPRVGWVLARMIDADIPDEVAQYAEGRRITSYYALSQVQDGGQVKKNWLWTTIERGLQPFEFDSFRVFNWSLRRNRYETAYIERNLKAFFPLTVESNVATRYGAGPGFSVIVEKKDGRKYRRRYVMVGHLVRLYEEELEKP